MGPRKKVTFEPYRKRFLGKQTKKNQWLQEIPNGPTNTTVMYKMSPTHHNAGLVLQFGPCHTYYQIKIKKNITYYCLLYQS